MCIGFIAFNLIFHRNNGEFKASKSTDKLMGPSFNQVNEANRAARPAFLELEKEIITIKTDDGISLNGYFYKCPVETENTVILIHGYNSSPLLDFPSITPFYLNNGYNVLCANNRGGKFGNGSYTSFGTLERIDSVKWVQAIAQKYPNGNIFLHGCSLGGAIVCLMSELDMPNVRAILSDCAFTSISEEFATTCKTMAGFVPNVCLKMIFAWYKVFFKHTVDEFTPEKSVKNAKYPMLFIHGKHDRFIPVSNCEKLYAACSSEKETYTIDGAGHAASFVINTDGYAEHALNWFKKYTK